MTLVIILGLVISLYFRGLGLIYLIPALGKLTFQYPMKNINFLIIWVLAVLTAGFFKIIDPLTSLTLTVSVGLTVFMISRELLSNKVLEKALIITATITSVVECAKFYFYSEVIKQQLELSINTALTVLKTKYPVNGTEYTQISDFINISKNLYLNYNYAFAIFIAIVATWLGLMILSKIIAYDFKFCSYFTPNFIVYAMIGGLIALLIPQAKYAGENIIIVTMTFFFIQGLAVAWFYYGVLLKSSVILLILFSLSLILNPYLIILLALVGIIDTWFDLRKLNKLEETHENNLN